MCARLRALGLVLLLAALRLAACDDKKEEPKAASPTETSAARPSAAATPAEGPRPTPDRIPDISVDTAGVNLGGDRVVMTAPDSPKKLRDAVARVSLSGKAVTVVALRTARTPDVAALVAALGEAGVIEVSLRTQDRTKKDATLKVVPERKLGKLEGCTVIAMVQKDRTTASWPVRGATATRYPRGMAGPDLSSTVDGVRKQLTGCASTVLVISGDDTVEWGLTFDLADRLQTADPPLKIATWALAREAPVAGRAVKGGD